MTGTKKKKKFGKNGIVPLTNDIEHTENNKLLKMQSITRIGSCQLPHPLVPDNF